MAFMGGDCREERRGSHTRNRERLAVGVCLSPSQGIRSFGTSLTNPGGLSHLPAWVRSWRRVHNWIAGKLILHAAKAANKREALMQ